MTAWSLIRERDLRELRDAERLVRELDADTTLSVKARRRRRWQAVGRRDRLRARLRWIETAIANDVPFPRELSKQVALAAHFDHCARRAARSGDARTAAEWSTRCRDAVNQLYRDWCRWNSPETKNPPKRVGVGYVEFRDGITPAEPSA